LEFPKDWFRSDQHYDEPSSIGNQVTNSKLSGRQIADDQHLKQAAQQRKQINSLARVLDSLPPGLTIDCIA
jgi:hypothetical protein